MSLRMGTSESGGTFDTQGAAIAELFNRKHPGATLQLVRSDGASIDNANLLDRGEIEFGFMASNWIGRAKDAIAPFTSNIDLRMAAPVNAGPIFFVTLAGSAIKTVDDFRAKRIIVGARGSGMVEHVRTIFNVLNIPFDSFMPVYLGFAEGAEALLKGEADAQFQPPIPNRVMTELSRRAAIRVVGYAPGQIEKVLAHVSFYRGITIEKGAFHAGEEDIPQIAVVNVLVTHARVPESAVRNLVETIVENLDVLPRMNPLFKGIEELFAPLRSRGAAALEFGGVALHLGALGAYEAAGLLA